MHDFVNLMSADIPLVSVYTCVYNGEKTINRVFNTMKNLTYSNIEHIIVNDGSTDNTELLIKEYIKQVRFPVKYHKKENGGKHSALNVAWQLATGEFMISLDADDELYPDVIESLLSEYYSIPENIRDQYWVVNGRCVTQYGDFVGVRYPEGINEHNWKDALILARKCSGEKASLQVRKYLSEYKFPDVVGVSFIPESIIWTQIGKMYGGWYTNKVVRVYYVNEPNSLTTSKHKTRKRYGSFTYYSKWMIMHPESYNKTIKTLCKYSFGYCISDKTYRFNNKYLDGIENKKDRILLWVMQPFMLLLSVFYRIVKNIN